jgi:hypothetical protein
VSRAREFWRELVGIVRWRRERDAQAVAWEQARVRDREWHTGVWRSRSGALARVRFDPVLSRFFVWDKTGIGSWRYETRDRAARWIRALERAGWEPDRGARTAEVRTRLLSEFLGP